MTKKEQKVITQKEPKQKKKREYSSLQVTALVNMHEAYPKLTIRDLSKMSGVSKSVVGRWIKKPAEVLRQTEAKEIIKQINESDKKTYTTASGRKILTREEVKANMKRMLKEIKENGTELQQTRLEIQYDETVGYEVYSGWF